MSFLEKTKLEYTDNSNNSQVVSPSAPLPIQEVSTAHSLLARILNALRSPRGYDATIDRTRGTVTVETGTIGTVTTVTTVTTVSTITNMQNATQIGSRPAEMLINQTNYSAWADIHRKCIT